MAAEILRASLVLLRKGAVDAADSESLSVSNNSRRTLRGNETSGHGIQNPSRRSSAPGFAAIEAGNLYYVSPVVNSMIRIGADAVSMVPLRVGVDTEKGFQQVNNSMLARAISFVNPTQTIEDFLYHSYCFYTTFGVQFTAIEITPPEHAAKSRVSLYNMNPLYVEKVFIADSGGDFYWKYRPPTATQAIYFSRSNVIEHKSFNPLDSWIGCVNIGALGDDIRIERAAKQQLASFYERATKFGGQLLAKGAIDREAYDELDAILNGNMQYRPFRNLILEDGQEYKPIESNGTDAHLPEILGTNLDSHSMMLGIPIGILHGKTGGSGAGVAELETLMWTKTLQPWVTRFLAGISKHLGGELYETSKRERRNQYVNPNWRKIPALRVAMLNEMRVLSAAMTIGGITANEFREAIGYEHLEDDENKEFANMLRPAYQAKYKMTGNGMGTQPGANNQHSDASSPSMSLPGGSSSQGRDRSGEGEAAMPDTSGQKKVKETPEEMAQRVIAKALGIFSGEGKN